MNDLYKLNPRLLDHFVMRAREYGFTEGDIRWMLREARDEFFIESSKPGLHFGLVLDILKKKVESMKAARRIVREVCEDLGIRTERV